MLLVVTAEYGLNGHAVIGVFDDLKKADEAAQQAGRDKSYVTGFGGIDVIAVQMNEVVR